MESFSSIDGKTLFAVAVILVTALMMHVRWSRKASSLGPTVLTTMGIFFCFLGIALGLLDLNTADISKSVPTLLSGIRTAFWASVVGVGSALTIKLRLLLQGEPELPSDSTEGATVDDLAALLERLNKSLAGTEDSTLLSQTKLLRSDTNDRLDRLNGSFEKFAERMTEANTKALIQALSDVIRDFNNKLTEQFGENFKQLNAAVTQLVVWQRQYEIQLNSLITQETTTRENMSEAAARYNALLQDSEKFVNTNKALSELLQTLIVQRNDLHKSMEKLGNLIDKSATGLPEIEKKVVEMTRQLDASVRQQSDTMSATLKASALAMTTSVTQLTEALTKSMDKANSELNAHVKKLSEDTNRQIVALDTALEQELTKSIESLGRQLTALSQKFVEDYTPLTDRLSRILTMARVPS